MEYFKSLNGFFENELKELNCNANVKSYIVGIFSKFKYSDGDLSNRSITIEYGLAKFESDFSKFQNIGDYLFFASSLYPESLNSASKEYFYSIGQMSYYACYKMVNSWKIYEEMSDQFIDLSKTTRKLIHKS